MDFVHYPVQHNDEIWFEYLLKCSHDRVCICIEPDNYEYQFFTINRFYMYQLKVT